MDRNNVEKIMNKKKIFGIIVFAYVCLRYWYIYYWTYYYDYALDSTLLLNKIGMAGMQMVCILTILYLWVTPLLAWWT